MLINGKVLSYGAIRAGQWVQEDHDAYACEVLAFIQKWLGGQACFSLTTSGTTNTPKRCFFSRAQMIASARASLRYFDVPLRLPFFVGISARYAGGMMQIVRALLHGAPLHIVTPSIYPFGALRSNYALLSAVPVQLHEMLTRKKTHLLTRIHTLLVGGSALSSFLDDRLRRLKGVRIYEGFGMTETLSHVALRRVNRHPQKAFHTLPGVCIRVDESDCLVIESPVVKEPVHTRDVVRIVQPGHFVWCGRADDMVNVAGIKFSLGWLEDKIQSVFSVAGYTALRYFCHPATDPKWGQRILLFLLEESLNTQQRPRPTPQSLFELLQQKLPTYAVPSVIHLLPAMAYTPTQKIDRTSTLAQFWIAAKTGG